MTLRQNQDGAVMLYTVLVIGLAALAFLSALSRTSIGEFYQIQRSIESQQGLAQLMGCEDELLIQLQADPNFSATTIESGTATCDLALSSPQPSTRSANLSLTSNSLTRQIHLDFSVSPVVVTSVSESF
ncbi:hypothetical protein HZA85_02130 [Candidatus Uhrbacteria bacterium]|nr:hypothetical protein [Candidatus Uhrbacteria bacterium]